ncbi:DUF1697 domain-containing protein [Streptomyces syringium]|uniref:DUF1697 domain-containing protein n=1 Tax=Streptomyces syringium TaxID=76729 RepID=UPI0033FBB558
MRGINVGTEQRVPIRTVRDLRSGPGCGSVRSHLDSGKAVFTHPRSGRPSRASWACPCAASCARA